MAAPTIAITAHEPATLMDPCPVGYSVDFGTFVSGDSSLLDDCMFYWYLTARNASSLNDIPDRYRYATDPRDATVTIDRCGASSGTGLTRNIGYSYSIVLPAGDWTVHLVVINTSGESSTASRDFTVAANTRTVNTLKASGGDHSTWDSAVSWLRNGANRQITVDFDFSGDCNLCNPDDNLAYIVSSDPTNATKPRMTHDASTGNANRLLDFTNSDYGMVVDSIELNPSSASVEIDAVRMRGSNIALINCDILGDPFTPGDYFNTGILHSSINASTDTQLVFGCTVAGSRDNPGLTKAGYTVHTENTSPNTYALIHHFGGSYKGSVNESIFRDTSGGGDLGTFTHLAYCNFDNSDVQSKSCIRMQFGRYCNVVGIYALDGNVGSGVWGTPSGDSTGAKNHAFDGCISAGLGAGGANFDIRTDARDIRLRNCFAGDDGISMGDGTADTNDENINVRIYNCSTTGDISGPGITTPGAITGFELKGCIGVGCTINTTTTAAGAIDANAWDDDGTLTLDGVGVTLATWNADGDVGTDVEYATVTFSGKGVPTASVNTLTVLPENPIDIMGNARSATTEAGTGDSATAAPTVSNRTPADNATGVSTAQTISMQFSTDMQAGTGTIELRQVSDDSVLDSINAADATINIGDRTQVTLTGLALTGVSGAVYVYIPAGAFESRGTAVPFAGYTTSTDWNFTVGAATGGERARDRSRLR